MANPHPLKVLACETVYGYHHVKWGQQPWMALECYRCRMAQTIIYRTSKLLIENLQPKADPPFDIHIAGQFNFTPAATFQEAERLLGVAK